MSTPVKWMDAAALDGLPRNADCLDDDQYDALRSQARAALALRDELAEWKDKLGAMTAAHRYATDELAECRALVQLHMDDSAVNAREADDLRAKLAAAEANAAENVAAWERGEAERVELRKQLAQAEQERDGARLIASVRTREVEEADRVCTEQVAAAQAENVELRNVVAASEAEWRKLSGPASAWSDGDARRDAAKDIADDHARVLARPADVAALRVMLLEWAGGVWALAAPDREMDANTITAELDRRLRGGK